LLRYIRAPKIGGLQGKGGENWVPIEHNVAWAEAYLRTKWYPDPYSHLDTIDMDRGLYGLG